MSSHPLDAASVWAARSSLKPHFRDGLDASADSDYYVDRQASWIQDRTHRGMRTIRWRNGQCPGRNGQWAERIAHAGSEAVRLVPFSSLPALILDYLLTEYCVSAWR